MVLFEAILAILDSRSFSTVWYWLMLATCWSLAGRSVLGVPPDVVHKVLRANPDRAGHDPRAEEGAAIALFDWLSLMLPRWRVDPREGVWLTGLAAFALAILATLGFFYGLEMAQALFLLAAPFGLLAVMRYRLARKLAPTLEKARDGALPVIEAARIAARPMRQHRFATSAMSILTVSLAAYWGAMWLLAHPFGF